MAESVLDNWRAAGKAASVMMPSRGPTFIRWACLADLTIENQRGPCGNHNTAGGIEIVLPNGARVSVDASVNEQALSRVLRAMKSVT